MRHSVFSILAIFVTGASVVDAAAATRIDFASPVVVSAQVPDFDQSFKGKPVALESGMLLVVYGDAVENDPSKYVFELHGGDEHPARDVFVRTCDDTNSDCTLIANWSAPLNLSNTATLSSANTDWRGTGVRTPYYGDAENAHVFDSGKHVVITWVDKYCPGGAQRTVTHADFDDRELPMSCTYAAHSSGSYGSASSWTVNQLSDGSRDAKVDISRGLSNGAWMLAWQEDPLGLQPGEAEGPGEGASGANVSKGTDIWYAYTSNVNAAGAAPYGVWSTPIRLTDNRTGSGVHGNVNPVRGLDGNPVDPSLIDKGIAGASRPNVMLVGGTPPTAIIAYEETKGSQGEEEGKFVRYHVFAYNDPPDPAARSVDPAERAGCIVSAPAENARRVRFVTQTTAGSKSGMRMAMFWRQGQYSQGAPADIALRLGIKTSDGASTGFRPADLYPNVDPACAALDFDTASTLVNAPVLNISSNTPVATSANLADASGTNSLENARAHRAIVRGDDLFLAYTYTPDGVLAQYTPLENYNLYLRRYDAAAGTWSVPKNISNISDKSVNVVEPRLVPTPGNGPGCASPTAPVNPQDCQDKNTFYVAWGTERHTYDYLGGPADIDLFVTRTTDKAKSFEPIVVMAGASTQEGESQLQSTPDGNRLYAVWNARDDSGAVDSWFAIGTPVTIQADLNVAVTAASATVTLDDATVFEVTVGNQGPHAASSAQFLATLPAELQFVSSDVSCAQDDAQLTCDVGAIDAGTTRVIKVNAIVKGTGVITVPVSVSSEADDAVLTNNTATGSVTGTRVSDLSVAIGLNAISVKIHRAVTFGVSARNDGPNAALATRIVVNLPAGWIATSAAPDIGTCSVETETITCVVDVIDTHGAASIVIVAEAARKGDAIIYAAISHDDTDPDATDNATAAGLYVATSDSGVFGCALTGNSSVDPTLPLVVLLAGVALMRRRAMHAPRHRRLRFNFPVRAHRMCPVLLLVRIYIATLCARIFSLDRQTTKTGERFSDQPAMR